MNMIKKIFDMPRPLIHKIFLTPVIGLGCFILGLVYHCRMHDPVFFGLSGAVLLICAYKTLHFYRIGINERYEAISGTVVRISPKLLGKFSTVKIMDDNGIETTLRLPKSSRLRIGNKYDMYFAKDTLSTGRSGIDERISTDSLLGYQLVEKDNE